LKDLAQVAVHFPKESKIFTILNKVNEIFDVNTLSEKEDHLEKTHIIIDNMSMSNEFSTFDVLDYFFFGLRIQSIYQYVKNLQSVEQSNKYIYSFFNKN
jgi:hypothetical protein